MSPESILDREIALTLIKDMADLSVQAVTWTGGGEPTLHPDFPQLCATAHEAGLEQGLFTNALAPPKYDPSLFKWIRVSNTDKAWNLKNLSALRTRAKVLGMAVNYTGDHEVVHEALRVGKEIGVDYVQVRQALSLHGFVTSRPPPVIDDPLLFVTSYKFEDSANKHGYSKCYGFNFVPFIWHNGDVDVCGYHPKKGGPYTLGNLKQTRLAAILAAAPRHVPVIESCQVCCKNHEINKLVNKALDVTDINFV
jgi:MoaA/NifB/PqqE/SkfB family radical SAM enzyme